MTEVPTVLLFLSASLVLSSLYILLIFPFLLTHPEVSLWPAHSYPYANKCRFLPLPQLPSLPDTRLSPPVSPFLGIRLYFPSLAYHCHWTSRTSQAGLRFSSLSSTEHEFSVHTMSTFACLLKAFLVLLQSYPHGHSPSPFTALRCAFYCNVRFYDGPLISVSGSCYRDSRTRYHSLSLRVQPCPLSFPALPAHPKSAQTDCTVHSRDLLRLKYECASNFLRVDAFYWRYFCFFLHDQTPFHTHLFCSVLERNMFVAASVKLAMATIITIYQLA